MFETRQASTVIEVRQPKNTRTWCPRNGYPEYEVLAGSQVRSRNRLLGGRGPTGSLLGLEKRLHVKRIRFFEAIPPFVPPRVENYHLHTSCFIHGTSHFATPRLRKMT
jgi:hypothetical protein